MPRPQAPPFLLRPDPDLASGTPASPLLSYPPTSRCHSSPGSRSRFDFVPNVKAPRPNFRFRGGLSDVPGSSSPTPWERPLLLPRLQETRPQEPGCRACATAPLASWLPRGFSAESYAFPPFISPQMFWSLYSPAKIRSRRLFQTMFSNASTIPL